MRTTWEILGISYHTFKALPIEERIRLAKKAGTWAPLLDALSQPKGQTLEEVYQQDYAERKGIIDRYPQTSYLLREEEQ